MYAELTRMITKTCTKCSFEKPIERFQKNDRYKDVYHSWCKDCKKASKKAHPETDARWSANNPERVKANKQAYVDRNPEKVRDSKRRWEIANPRRKLANTRAYQAAKIQATPKWLTEEQRLEMIRIYENCPVGYEVDHDVPLRGKTVRGLHVPWNLKYMLPTLNRRKSNKVEKR